MTPAISFLRKYQATFLYALSLGILMFLLKWLELRFIIFDHSFEIYVGCIAILFTSLGIWLALKLSKPKIETRIVEKEVLVIRNNSHEDSQTPFVPNTTLLTKMEINKRELEVLDLIARGFSNQEIASKLFISLSTVKTHNQNLFAKLDVKRRTQAVEKAKRFNFIP